MHAMSIDDIYHVECELSKGPSGVTELVTIDGSGPFLRKRIPLAMANRSVWASLSECACPRLPQVAATYETPDEFVVVCSYFAGDTLAQVLAAMGCFSAEAALRIVGEVCEAVKDLHVHGVVHCDISPENIVIAADGAHLIDLGIARLMRQEFKSDDAALGTWGFAAPEQFGFAKVDERTDVFSLSCLLGCLLTGCRPDTDDYKALLGDGKTVPPQLCAVVEKGSAFEPSARFASAGAFIQAAKMAAAGEGEPLLSVAAASGSADAAKSQSDGSAGERSGENFAGSFGGLDAGREGAQERKQGAIAAKRRKIALIVVCAIALLVVAVFGGLLQGRIPLVGFISDSGSSATWGSSVNASETNDNASSDGALLMDVDDGMAEESVSHQGVSGDSAAAGSAAASSGSGKEVLSNILSLEETGWFVAAGDYIEYGFAVRNNSSDKAIIGPTVDIVGRDAAGQVISSDYQVIGEIQPGQTLYFGSIAGNGTAPHTVDFSVREPDAIFVKQPESDPAILRVMEVREVSDGFGGSNFAGEVVLEAGSYLDRTGQVAVTVVLRDSAGEMIGAFTDFAACPRKASPTTFEIVGGDIPNYASMEAYVQEW